MLVHITSLEEDRFDMHQQCLGFLEKEVFGFFLVLELGYFEAPDFPKAVSISYLKMQRFKTNHGGEKKYS